MNVTGPQSHDGRDDRRGRRVAVDLPGTLGGRRPGPVHVVDLSVVGCLVRTGISLVSGAVVDLRIDLPDGPLDTKATVAAASVDGDSLPGPSKHFLAGLDFLALGAADALRLRAYLDAEAKRRRGAHTPPA
jgi:PilZ domain-containing protein